MEALGLPVGSGSGSNTQLTAETDAPPGELQYVLDGVWKYSRSSGQYKGSEHWGTQAKFVGMQGWYNGPKGGLVGPEPPNYHLTSNTPSNIRGSEHWPGCGYNMALQGAIEGDGNTLRLTVGASTCYYTRDSSPYVPISNNWSSEPSDQGCCMIS